MRFKPRRTQWRSPGTVASIAMALEQADHSVTLFSRTRVFGLRGSCERWDSAGQTIVRAARSDL